MVVCLVIQYIILIKLVRRPAPPLAHGIAQPSAGPLFGVLSVFTSFIRTIATFYIQFTEFSDFPNACQELDLVWVTPVTLLFKLISN